MAEFAEVYHYRPTDYWSLRLGDYMDLRAHLNRRLEGDFDPDQFARLPAVVIHQPNGVESLTISVPNNPALAGLPVFTQALLASQERFTNVTADVVDQ